MFAKKSLGQNFLKSQEALRAMVEAGNVQAGDVVLEVGPGKGVLTKKLLEAGAIVHAIEKDDRLIETLQQTFAGEIAQQKLFIHHQDALTFDPATLASASYKIIANIPYYITGQFFRIFLTAKQQPNTMVIMVQKEVAQRMVARDSKESLLSLSVKAYGDVSYIMTVQKKYFSPAPKVDSAIVAVHTISRNFFDGISEETFFESIKAGFAHKRKVLISNLSSLYETKKLTEVFGQLSIDPKIRAEDLTLSDWKQLLQKLN